MRYKAERLAIRKLLRPPFRYWAIAVWNSCGQLSKIQKQRLVRRWAKELAEGNSKRL